MLVITIEVIIMQILRYYHIVNWSENIDLTSRKRLMGHAECFFFSGLRSFRESSNCRDRISDESYHKVDLDKRFPRKGLGYRQKKTRALHSPSELSCWKRPCAIELIAMTRALPIIVTFRSHGGQSKGRLDNSRMSSYTRESRRRLVANKYSEWRE